MRPVDRLSMGHRPLLRHLRNVECADAGGGNPWCGAVKQPRNRRQRGRRASEQVARGSSSLYTRRSRSAASCRAYRRSAQTASAPEAMSQNRSTAKSTGTGAMGASPCAVRTNSAAGPKGSSHVTERTDADMNERMGTTATSVSGTARTLDDICSVAISPQASPASSNGCITTSANTPSPSVCTGEKPRSRQATTCAKSAAAHPASHFAAAYPPGITPTSASVRHTPRSRSSAIT